LARAKNTTRAVARKRTRDDARAELAAQQEPEDGGEATAETAEANGYRPRRSGVLFKWPNIRADIASIVPQFRAKPLLWLPFGLILFGFVLYLVYFGLPPEIQQFAVLYLQFFFTPAALFTYFIAGFLATRASYIFGGLAGLAIGVLTVVAYIVLSGVTVDPTGANTQQLSGTDLLFRSIALIAQTTLIGAAAGGFAGWYRDFLRRMQDNSRAKQAQREQDAKAKRAAERQESRKAAKQRSAS
jgi:signal transduction histidine kinase